MRTSVINIMVKVT